MKKSSAKVNCKENTDKTLSQKDKNRRQEFSPANNNFIPSGKVGSLIETPLTSENIQFLQHNIGNHAVNKHIQTQLNDSIQRDPQRIDMPEEEMFYDKHAGEMITDIPSEKQDIDNYIEGIKTHLSGLIDRHQTAFNSFGRQVQDKDLGSSEANILKTALKKGIEIGTKKLVDVVGTKVPGLSEAFDIAGALKSEVDRASEARTEDKMDTFINGIATEVVTKLTSERTRIQNENVQIRAEIRRRLATAGAPDSNERIVWLVNNIVHPTQALAQLPSVPDIELGMVQEWLSSIRGKEYSGFLGGWTTKGHLFFYYEVDEEEGTYRLVDKALAGGDYANTLLEVLREDVFKDKTMVNMTELGLPSVVRVKSEQNRMKDDTFDLGPGTIRGGDDAWHMFSRFIEHVPEQINLQSLEAKDKVFI